MEKLEPLKQIKNIETGKEDKLNLCEVMHRRELLIAFFESVDAEDMEQQRNGKGWKVVDRYLEAIYSA